MSSADIIAFAAFVVGIVSLGGTVYFAYKTYRHDSAGVLFDAMFRFVELTSDDNYVPVREVIQSTSVSDLDLIKKIKKVQLDKKLNGHLKVLLRREDDFALHNGAIVISDEVELSRLRAELFRVVNTIEAIATMYRVGFVPPMTFVQEFRLALRRDDGFLFVNFLNMNEPHAFPSIKFLYKEIDHYMSVNNLK